MSLKENKQQEENIKKVLQAQSNISPANDTEFSMEESVQEALVKSRNEEINKNQPTYELNKAF
ncbi:hypothetical protein CIB95_13685 [Lottiidibacillus patelloidae]|uniref:Uncharacterized protein n=1 Tax=Lottiidibacillus patelloidae TaxID=2670334 RepID=A0A263BRE9_9BACI|nr:hypothetical protein [Lottiidibacillus patelloidae]OZM56152.1 hypothetical protein CIB95_13685 [Lottiidibacillus patelloidae]